MPRKWEPSPNDAISLGAFRWFANALENAALELYATDRESYRHIERILRNALKEMSQTRMEFAVSQEENGCPDGYLLCEDGLCKPSCDWIADVAREAQAYKGPAPAK